MDQYLWFVHKTWTDRLESQFVGRTAGQTEGLVRLGIFCLPFSRIRIVAFLTV